MAIGLNLKPIARGKVLKSPSNRRKRLTIGEKELGILGDGQ